MLHDFAIKKELTLRNNYIMFSGYTTTVLGVRSHCKLRDIPQIPDNKFEVEIVPRLPQISMSTSLPKAAAFSNMADTACVITSATACLYAGQWYVHVS